MVLFDSVWFGIIQFEKFWEWEFWIGYYGAPALNTWIIWNTKIASKSFPASEMTKLRKCSTRQKTWETRTSEKSFILEWRNGPKRNDLNLIWTFSVRTGKFPYYRGLSGFWWPKNEFRNRLHFFECLKVIRNTSGSALLGRN